MTETEFRLNGRVVRGQMADYATLAAYLRDNLGHFEVKAGCGEGVCGACTVLLDGEPLASCLLLARQAEGCTVETVAAAADGLRQALAEAFVRWEAAQCGYCTPGMLLTAYAYVKGGGSFDSPSIRRALAGNLCRCTGYQHIIDAIAEVVSTWPAEG
ncbi:MAG: 2Fe-2S iron-sulfur cluster-binding protein [Thermaerobacter sp.]|nr:2Fe-2S iron-sulfur cluster-binding protein [Thermaerobacter sp.]